MMKTAAPLLVDQVIAFAPVAGVTVRLQRTQFTFVVTVEHTLLVDELRRAYAGEAEARGYARGLCLGLRAGWTVDRLVEVAAVATTIAA